MTSQTPPQGEMKLTIARLIELSYRKNEGVTSSLIREAGNVRLTVDQNGNASLSGKAGSTRFSASEATKQLGIAVRRVTVMMSVDDDGNLRYNASFDFPVASVTVRGSIDVEALILACSGLLCRAARLINGRSVQRDRQLQEAMGY